MSDIPLPIVQDFLDNVQSPEQKGRSGQGNQILWCGIVQSVNVTTGKATVNIAGTNVNVKSITGLPAVGTTVWGVQEGRVKIMLGELTPYVPAMVKIGEHVAATDVVSLDVPNIPAGFRSLEVRFNMWATNAAITCGLRMVCNGDTGTNYQGIDLYTTGAVGTGRWSSTSAVIGEGSTLPSHPAGGRIQIEQYDKADRYKRYLAQTGGVYQGQGDVEVLTSGRWMSSAVLNRIQLLTANGYLITAGSYMTVYGMR